MEDTQTTAMEQEKNLFDEDPPDQKESKTDALLSLRRAMASGAAPNRGASQPATDASPTPGASQAPSGAPVVEPAQELRQALDGGWYTMEEFMKYYQKPHEGFSVWWWYWEQVVRGIVPRGAASTPPTSAQAPPRELRVWRNAAAPGAPAPRARRPVASPRWRSAASCSPWAP